MVTHSSTLAWRIQWTEEPGESMDHKELGITEQLKHTYINWFYDVGQVNFGFLISKLMIVVM